MPDDRARLPAPAGALRLSGAGSGAARTWAGLGAASIALLLVVGALGPSAAVVPLGAGTGRLADPWLVTGLMWAAAGAGGGCLVAGLLALRRGWQPHPHALLAAGLVATAALLVVPPLGNGDIGSYAAYGRAAVLGASPYTTTPADLTGDPVAAAAEAPWLDQVSVYGPVATGVHYLAALLGQDSRAAVLRLLAGVAALGFAAVGLVLGRRAADPRRAHVLWTCNPLLLLHLVASAHVDVFVCLLLVLAVTSRRGALRTGLALGTAVAVKVTAGLSVLALLAAERRRALPAVAVASTVGLALYALVGVRTALQPVLDARSRVSGGTPWRWAASAFETVLPEQPARLLVSLGVLGLAVALVRALHRDLPSAEPFLRMSAVLWLAYLFAAGYQLAWYDSVGYVLLALLAANRWDGLLIAHTLMLTVAYLPGRVVTLPEALDDLLVGVRSGVSPAVLLVIWLVALRVSRSSAGRSGRPRSPRRSPAAGAA